MKIKLLQIPSYFISNILIFVFGFSLATAQQIELTKEEQQWIDEHPTIRAAGGTDYVPIQFMRNGKANGLSIDYVNLIASKVGLNVEYVNGFTWEQHIEKIYNKELDIISSISSTLGRDEFLNFSDPYVHLPYVYYGRVGSDPINDIKDLEGKRIGAIDGWNTTEAYKKDYKHLILVEQRSLEEALQSLSDGSIDVFIVPEAIGNYIIRQNFITGLEIIGERFIPEIKEGDYLQIGIRKDWPILNDIIKKGIAAVSKEENNIIFEKWIAGFQTNTDIGLTKEELAWLYSHPIIKVGANIEVKPIEFVDADGTIKGIAGDYLDEISRLLNIKFEWVGNQTWDEALTLAKNGRIDLLSAVVLTEEREKYLDFTDSYLTIANMIFTQTGKGIYENLESLEGLSISAETGDVNVENIKLNHPDITVIEANSAAEAIKLAAIGAADAYVGGLPTTSFYMAEESITNISAVGETPYISKLSMGVPKGNSMLVGILNKAIRSISQKRKSEIVSEWYSLKIENKPNYELIINLSIVGTLLLALILYWNNRLRKEVLYRKKVEEKLIISQQKTEEESSAKSIFLANMSHELRTPLNAIIGFSEALTLPNIRKHPGKVVEYQRYIADSGKHLLSLINDILDLSKVEEGKFELNVTICKIDDLLNEVIETLHLMAENNKVAIRKDVTNIEVNTDDRLIRQILINLLSNAIKFSPNGGEVQISVSDIDNGVAINIQDNGIGMSSNELSYVLEPFRQVENAYTKTIEGTGLGLALVQRFVLLVDGKMDVLSTKGEGTMVKLHIPNLKP